MVHEPTFSFTIPSYDDTVLECRVYNPSHPVLNSVDRQWSPRGAVVAHPYAPMGGCFDDNVVMTIAAELLKQEFVVGTFNFRGAGCSGGRTSWQAKAELEDYIYFTGFFVHYVDGFWTSQSRPNSPRKPESTLSPNVFAHNLAPDAVNPQNASMKLVLAGYSYGSLIASHLPTTETILKRFQNVTNGSAEAEVRLRAASLSAQSNKDAQVYCEAQYAHRSTSHEKLRTSARAMAVIIGGDECEPGSRRMSHEGRRSMEAVRRSMDRSRKKLGLGHHSHDSEISGCVVVEEDLGDTEISVPQTHYLLISPLLPPISMFATMSIHSGRTTDWEEKLIENPTLVIYGDDDIFTSQKKLRRWAEGWKAKPRSHFQFLEVPGAGHFWREEGSDHQLRSAVRQWSQQRVSQPTG